MAASTAAAVALTSLAVGLKTGVTQGVVKGDKDAVTAGLGQIAQGDLNKAKLAGLPAPTSILATPQLMPTVNQDKIKQARVGALQSLQARTGRASTLLTSPQQNNKFGG